MNGTLTADEEQQLHQLLQHAADEEALSLLQGQWENLEEPLPLFKNYDVEQAWRKIVYPENGYYATPSRSIVYLRKWWWAAASLLLALSIGIYFLSIRNDKPDPLAVTNAADIHPGKEGAILTLADGSAVSLDSIRNGVIAMQGGATARVVNGVLQYDGNSGEVLYNTTSTPRGRQFQLTLPDGTRAWLNAASSLRYPTSFAENERRVEVSGEVYFEVAKLAHKPFLVKIDAATEVEVLGTSFNINAYRNESGIYATLLSGSIKVNRIFNDQSNDLILKPGQQAAVSLTQSAIERIEHADTEKIIAWKNGRFNFHGVPLQQVMRQLERWYDIEVVYENGIPDLRLGGELERDLTLAEVLDGLKESKLNYRLEKGRRLVILP
ncbi:FecR domain-containing protein [Pseudoflavitalea sp. G-6-1-2]|uniref:FecR family protein n=1 Tax=Pseudoflavitalea sp. G-6-1-2 TaxID=2728841 RepID=UPI001F0ECE31|nr:FecR domain-containing protein [Pseudoflavitalea sp. G-6-1-2]